MVTSWLGWRELAVAPVSKPGGLEGPLGPAASWE